MAIWHQNVKKGTKYSTPADVYSLAVTIEKLSKAAKTSKSVDPVLRPIVKAGKNKDPDERPTAPQLLEQLLEARESLTQLVEKRNQVRPGLRTRNAGIKVI